MANLTKLKRDEMLSFIEKLRSQHTDIDSLKSLSDLEKYIKERKLGLVFEKHTENVDEMLLENIPVLSREEDKVLMKNSSKKWNFLIEADNLHALHILRKTHKGKVDCIYIDPPYNTGAHDWKYNNDYVDADDDYRHSKWLSMMKERLDIASELLNPKGSVLICTIDDKEYLHLGCLLEEIFPNDKITMISSVINPAGKAKKGGVDFSRIDEYVFFVQIGVSPVLPEVREFSKTPIAWETFRRHSLANGRGKHGVGACGPNQFYPIYVDNATHKIVEIGQPIMEDVDRFSVKQIEGCSTVFPVRDNGIEMNWGATREEALRRLNKGYLKVGQYFPDAPQQYSIQYLTKGVIKDIETGKVVIDGYDSNGGVNGYYIEGRAKVPTTAWNKKSHNATSYGTDILNKLFTDQRFDYPKSLYAVKDCLGLFIANKPDALVLDFFAGSGTTLHAVNLLNLEDNGNRRCILVTNNEIGEINEKKLTELGYKKGDTEWEKIGIARYVTWPRTVCSINGVDIDGNPLEGNYGVEVDTFVQDEDSVVISKKTGKPTKNIVYKQTKTQVYPNLAGFKMCDGFDCNVKYFKADYVSKKDKVYYDYADELLQHIRELVELENGIDFDSNEEIKIILSEEELDEFCADIKDDSKVNTIYIGHDVLPSLEQTKILDKYKILANIIPNYYYKETEE